MRHVLAILTLLLVSILPRDYRLSASVHDMGSSSTVQSRTTVALEQGRFLPLVLSRALPHRQWDPRLTERGAALQPAQVASGEGYWRLIQAVWYAENEPPMAGQHHIFVDVLDARGNRQPGVPIQLTTLDGAVEIGRLVTEEKRGELYAGNFPMWEVAPFYRAIPADGAPADAVTGMGMGSIELPGWKIHTSYGLVWQWTVAP